MNLKKIILPLILFIQLYACADYKIDKATKYDEKLYYSSSGFALIYEDILYKQKVVNRKLPIGIGFGVSTPADVKKYVSVGVDAVIVGSANLKIIGNTPPSKLQNKITKYTKKLKMNTRI